MSESQQGPEIYDVISGKPYPLFPVMATLRQFTF